MPQKISNADQVLADLKNVIVFLKACEAVMPETLLQEGAIDALQAIANSPALLTLLVTSLQKI